MNNERPLKTQPLCGQNQLPYKSPDWLFYGWRLTCTKWGMTDELILHSFISTTGLWGQTLLLLSALKLVSDTYAGIRHTAYGMSLFNMKLKVKWLDEVHFQTASCLFGLQCTNGFAMLCAYIFAEKYRGRSRCHKFSETPEIEFRRYEYHFRIWCSEIKWTDSSNCGNMCFILLFHNSLLCS